jgi:hypothetical protein
MHDYSELGLLPESVSINSLRTSKPCPTVLLGG